MAIQRLSGGLTPADGADPRTFPTIWNDFADQGEVLFSQARVQNQRWNNLTINDFNDIDSDSPEVRQVFIYDGSVWAARVSPQYNTGLFYGVAATWTVPGDFIPQHCRITITGGAGGAGTNSTGATSGGDGGTSTLTKDSVVIASAIGGKGGPWGGSSLAGQAATSNGYNIGDLYQSNARPFAVSNSNGERSRGNNGAPGASQVIYYQVNPGDVFVFSPGAAGTTVGSSVLKRSGELFIEYTS